METVSSRPSRPFRFGVINERMTTRQAWLDGARRAEALGFSTFLIRDHLVADHFGDQFAPFPALTAAAMVTSTLRVGSLVIDNDFRHPALLAKEAATLDLLSDDRFELGLGAGWLAAEYRQAGIPFDAAGVRISRMEESVQIIKGLWSGEPVSFAGSHYALDGLRGYPMPAQRPHPPLLIGGGGRRILTLAGREADIVGILTTSVTSGSPTVDPAERRSASVARKIGWIREGAGPRFADIELSLVADLVVTDDRRGRTEAYIREHGWDGLAPEDVWDMPAVLIGSTGQIVDALRDWRERLGISYLIVADADRDALAPIVAELAGT
ncbi:MAG: TIGR03621 family F420-dependent LLM class oxidoreductase [Thermomicrobiales bacterium]